MTEPKTYLTERFHKAMAYATELHKDQSRKSTTITYISHPFGVASLVLEANGDEDQAIAALLHDIPEDCGGEPRLKEIAEMFGSRVEKIVRGCSDSLVEDPAEKAPWRDRKEVHINHLNDADMDTLIVILSLSCVFVIAVSFLASLLGWAACKLGSDDDDRNGRG
jgi:(p)ppGpp synthase/HD superfamily hydrolase